MTIVPGLQDTHADVVLHPRGAAAASRASGSRRPTQIQGLRTRCVGLRLGLWLISGLHCTVRADVEERISQGIFVAARRMGPDPGDWAIHRDQPFVAAR
jgi:hypothetical protein